MKTSDFRVTNQRERRSLRIVVDVEYDISPNFPSGLSPLSRVVDMVVRPNYLGTSALRVVDVDVEVIEPDPWKV